nr:immunoglobulin light chain junction region [Macaca mulatta]
CHHYYSTPRSF